MPQSLGKRDVAAISSRGSPGQAAQADAMLVVLFFGACAVAGTALLNAQVYDPRGVTLGAVLGLPAAAALDRFLPFTALLQAASIQQRADDRPTPVLFRQPALKG